MVYLRDLVAESITDADVRADLIRQFLEESGVKDDRLRESLDGLPLCPAGQGDGVCMMAGVRKSQLRANSARLGDYLSAAGDDYPFAVDPLPNLYFTRDPFATIGTGVSIHKMHTATRNRETLFGKFIFEHHPDYRNVPRWYDRGETSSLEGGDILILSPQVLAVGISQRTEEDSIDAWRRRCSPRARRSASCWPRHPQERSFMHLDTVFTMVDRDKFTVHPNILQQITVFVMELDENRKMKIRQEDGRLEDILKEHLELDKVTLIPCGQGSEIDAAREQWSDGSNTLAIAPGEVVVYSRNYVTTAPWRRPVSGSTPSPARS